LPAHAPPLQTSSSVQALPSSHVVPSSMGSPLHAPVAESHFCGPRHCVAPGHEISEPEQLPLWHLSFSVQTSWSSQVAPLVGEFTHPVAKLQLSAVHGLLSLHEIAALWQAPFVHVPSETWHLSETTQGMLSAFWQLPVALHALHAPHALLVQQKWSVQERPAAHSSLDAHVAPGGFLPQVFPTHVFGATQSLFPVHALRQSVLPPHTNGEHACGPPPWLQLPAPSQVLPSVCVDVPAGHDAGAHDVPAGHLRQAPAPLHLPSLRQVEASLTPHLPLGSLAPAATGEHVPGVPVSVHETHGPSHTALQHTFCAEHTSPEAHWLVAEHAPPFGCSPHEPSMQVAFGAQSALALHVPLQAAAPHA
jgi:hypothetical protein